MPQHNEPLNPTLRLKACAAAAAALARGLVRSAGVRRGGDSLVYNNGRNDGPPDLDELWRDFNRKLSGLFGGRGGGSPPGRGDGPGNFQPDMRSAGIGLGLIGAVVALGWLGSGFFIVQEGQQAVVTSFGKYSHTVDAGFQWRFPYPFQAHESVSVTQLRSVDAGFQWRFPYPFQAHESVSVTQLRSVEVGRNTVVQATGLRDSSMLTQDENIVDIRFTVQYRLSDARAYLFENRNPDEAVVQASESAVREIVGRSKVDSVLYEQRDAIAADLVKSVQVQMDRLKAGVVIANVNVQNVQVPDSVQAAFNDAVKAGADRDRFKNEGQAYASDVVPKARGTASRLLEESEGYRSRVIAQAEGDAQRFRSVLTEYQKAPVVTRDRLYLETMQQVYSNVTKLMVDSRSGSNLLYLPIDRLLQQGGGAPPAAGSAPAMSVVPAPIETQSAAAGTDVRSRDGARTRDREGR